MGVGLGAVYPLLLALFVDHAQTPEESGRLTAMAFFGGYLLASAGPFAAGALRDLTGSLALAFAILAAIAVLMAATTSPVTPRR
jgi:CP family cyanate transporter-like MFS transporter